MTHVGIKHLLDNDIELAQMILRQVLTHFQVISKETVTVRSSAMYGLRMSIDVTLIHMEAF